MEGEPTKPEPNPFTLNYTKRTIFPFIRIGNKKKPFPKELKCGNNAEYMDQYEEKMSGKPSRPADFLLDANGMIIYREGPEGLSTYRSLERLLANWNPRGRPGVRELWMLQESTPLPEEIEVVIDPKEEHHVLIKPARPPQAGPEENLATVTPDRFKQMLGCLSWVKYHKEGDG